MDLDSNFGGIGYKNSLPFFVKEDLKHFKELTSNKTIVMGRKTWDSLPTKPLPNRKNIVLSRQDVEIEGALVLNSIQDILTNIDEEIFIIGGSQIYKQFEPFASHIEVTNIYEKTNIDTYYNPNLQNFEIIGSSGIKTSENGIDFEFITYKRCKF